VIDRRTFLSTLTLGMLAAPPTSEAQQAGKVYRIGVLEREPMASNPANLAAFRQALAELGHVEGRNVAIVYRSADGRATRLVDLASELVRLKVDVIVTRGVPATLTARKATTTIPIVLVSGGDPVAAGIVANLARPEGNITGLHAMAPPELGRKRLHLLKEMVPGLSRVAVLWNSAELYSALVVRAIEAEAQTMGMQLKKVGFRSRWNFDEAFEEAILSQVDALVAVEDYQTFIDRTRVVDFANMSKLPAIYGLREFVDAGGLMSYGADRGDLFRRAAKYVHRILEGAQPRDLPVEQPTKFELVINLKAAKALGLTIPQSLLGRADQVIE
jgi:putative tryptophan/tyrosine transport system substrate-binding protein